jgi:HD-GYP domain-containing protein (c-di-GMP phosphodiesterase class II)
VLAGHAAVALENARLYEAQRREADGAKALLEFARELATAQGLDDVLSRTVAKAGLIIESKRVSLWMQDLEGALVPRAFHGRHDDTAVADAAAAVTPEWIERLGPNAEPFVLESEEWGTPYLIAPFMLEDGTRGCIAAELADPDPDLLERPTRLIAGLAHQAKLAIANASNFENLEGTFISTVEALANALEANDEYTSSHARWITDTSLKVGAALGLGPAPLKRLELGALFHDIGKIGIPSEILSKPGRLTDEERAVIETHPELGERIIAPISRLQDVRPVVRHCHERWDGEGYPDRLAGERIPLESRIVFVCDAFHAMTTDRPYRGRLTTDEAVRRLQEGSGSQFDPSVVSTFVRLLEEHGESLRPV